MHVSFPVEDYIELFRPLLWLRCFPHTYRYMASFTCPVYKTTTTTHVRSSILRLLCRRSSHLHFRRSSCTSLTRSCCRQSNTYTTRQASYETTKHTERSRAQTRFFQSVFRQLFFVYSTASKNADITLDDDNNVSFPCFLIVSRTFTSSAVRSVAQVVVKSSRYPRLQQRRLLTGLCGGVS